ncbi:head maturation protease, ClpP-related [Methylobacterium nodulans]|uniref:ATP-dependent Clp protease proteolytic subunit n=1 Tax=Methylobacterium nodulans (strain LMG 21967 / CNCM I-2342 / ORS 2060) TaxID=460265 RepID=B8ILU4_METNO|nr:head maturation protease, ClpP-related [Methylobacterium nodulans]ACL62069.1 peptidase S14 ClpP [Methylobacterium nodulans ORS 2060]
MDKILQLLISNHGRGAGARIVTAADGADEATVYVYDAIGSYYGIDAQTFVRELAAIEAGTIHLRLNSPGGDVFAARAMKTALEQHKAKVVAHIDGVAASAASFLMLAADEIAIADGAFVMIHEPWSLALGTADEMRASADLLDKVGEAIAADYQRRTGKSAEEVAAWMKAETWFSADEAIENGFADRKAEKAAVANAFDLTAFRNAPRALLERAPFDALAADRGRYEARLRLIERAA